MISGGYVSDYRPPTFEEKVKSMSASDIIMAMVESLTHPPIINIDMSSFGRVATKTTKYLFGLIKLHKRVCYGCAATNTICRISGITFTPNTISKRARTINSDERFLDIFESAINALRKGDISGYNYYAEIGKFAKIDTFTGLPYLGNVYTNQHLESYKKLAELQLNFEKYDKTRKEPDLQDCTL
jgi:hypothetical protein